MNRRLALDRETKQHLTALIQQYFVRQHDDVWGDLKAQLLYDFIVETFGPHFYNRGLNDMSAYIHQKIEDSYHLEL